MDKCMISSLQNRRREGRFLYNLKKIEDPLSMRVFCARARVVCLCVGQWPLAPFVDRAYSPRSSKYSLVQRPVAHLERSHRHKAIVVRRSRHRPRLNVDTSFV